ncbi:hypothetical protein RHSIM_Rhsim11G0079500 [Rhododendron simsii]|uniref:Uncharacterized protein n=1 Tax=Rhododendron simsii TaxID=118357 RepID=A0A834GCH6_RHOSS|nr:hypothetical protein RHSIM_Rhsim11G0079500 [Rhododendron simsii]
MVFPFDSTAFSSSATEEEVGEEGMEAAALLAWKASLDNQSQSLLSSWVVGSNHCDWIGVACRMAGRVITRIDLKSYGLKGTLSNLNFSSLPHILSLDLENNSFYGTIPSRIGCLSRLTNLSLSANSLSGSIPAVMGQLSNLKTLELHQNQIGGSIPHEIKFLISLTELSLYSNNLTGNLVNLTTLYLGANHLSGAIPEEVWTLRSLVDLELSINNLTGTIPSSIGNLVNLTTLYLHTNHLSGTIPDEVWTLRSLVDLQLSMNNLTGTIPASIGNLVNLATLHLGENHLSGAIPEEVGKLRSLINLQLSTNNLMGTIPTSIGNLVNLATLHLWGNHLSGGILEEVGMLRSLVDLQLSTNNLNGTIPASIGNLVNLTTLYLHTNHISGAIPEEVGKLRSLIDLELSTNNLNGTIPASIGNLVNLTTLYLHTNHLSGAIPEEVGKLSLHLSGNHLPGGIPEEVGMLRCSSMVSMHDVEGNQLPHLIYLRASTVISNATYLLNVDCDNYIINKKALREAMCFMMDPASGKKICYVQFPKRKTSKKGQSKENRKIKKSREALTEYMLLKILRNELKVGWIYGSVILTGFKMHCHGWRSVYCNPRRPGFKGSTHINLSNRLHKILQQASGSIEIFLSRHCPIWYGYGCGLKPLKRFAYINSVVNPFTSIPLITYCTLPAICLFTGKFIVPEINNYARIVFMALFISVAATSILEMQWGRVTLDDWWRNEQFWLISGVSSHFFALFQGLLKALTGVDANITVASKDGDNGKSLELHLFKWTSLLIPPMTLLIIIVIGVIVRAAGAVNNGYDTWGLLFAKFFFALWVILHLYPFLKGLMGERAGVPIFDCCELHLTRKVEVNTVFSSSDVNF